MQEGDAVPGLPEFSLTSFGGATGPVHIDDAGNVLWFGSWNDPDSDVNSGLFLNDQLLVQEGVSMVDGVPLVFLESSENGFHISDNGQWIVFRAQLEGTDYPQGAFLIQIPEPHGVFLIAMAGFAWLRPCRRHQLQKGNASRSIRPCCDRRS